MAESSGVTTGLSHGQNVAERGPLVTVRGSLANTRKKNLKIMVNPGVDGYTETLNHRKIIRKAKKIKNLLKTKIILKPTFKLSDCPIFKISLPGRGNSPLYPSSIIPLGKSAYTGHWLL